MIFNKIKNIHIDADFRPKVQHNPIEFNKDAIRLYLPNNQEKVKQQIPQIELSSHNSSARNSQSLDDALNLLTNEIPQIPTSLNEKSESETSNLKKTINRQFSNLSNLSNLSNTSEAFGQPIKIEIPKKLPKQMQPDLLMNPFAVFEDDESLISEQQTLTETKKIETKIVNEQAIKNTKIISTKNSNYTPLSKRQNNTSDSKIPKINQGFDLLQKQKSISYNNSFQSNSSIQNVSIDKQISEIDDTKIEINIKPQKDERILQEKLYENDKTKFFPGEAVLENGQLVMDYELDGDDLEKIEESREDAPTPEAVPIQIIKDIKPQIIQSNNDININNIYQSDENLNIQVAIDQYKSASSPLQLNQLSHAKGSQATSILRKSSQATKLAVIPLSQFTHSDQLLILRLLESELSEIIVNVLSTGDMEVQVSCLRNMLQNQKVKDAYNNQYIQMFKFLIFKSEIPADKQPKSQFSTEITNFRNNRENYIQQQQNKITKELLNPYLPTKRTLTWLNLQLQDIIFKYDQHIANQVEKHQKHIKVAQFKKIQPKELALVTFNNFMNTIYAPAKIGFVQKTQLYLEEIQDTAQRFYRISAAARILCILNNFQLDLEDATDLIPHRTSGITQQEAAHISSNNYIIIIIAQLFKFLLKQSKLQKISTNNITVILPLSTSKSVFRNKELKFPKQFESRILKFPLSRPVLANNLITILKEWKMDFNTSFIVTEIERMSIFTMLKFDDFEVEIYVLIEALMRVLCGFDKKFGGLLTEKEDKNGNQMSIEDILGI
ncbi:hypothetical protein SS50377_26374 [Spironucleus salmonicida]|uniref:Uncharacterized protein n=1 Tax=Spironucleus salmonicida TaxID=348837 RepID=V6M3A8_9EUKA|nr:hypothetical protein SS50377_26374 [Spironucleus salmonicida]|eukprot:EST47759.1 hypothetical protein SS50377_12158 [Spironucleus salmonicida]